MRNDRLNVSVNNQMTTLAALSTLDDLLRQLGYDPETSLFAVAVNKTFVPKEQYPLLQLQDKDQVDVLQPITGG